MRHLPSSLRVKIEQKFIKVFTILKEDGNMTHLLKEVFIMSFCIMESKNKDTGALEVSFEIDENVSCDGPEIKLFAEKMQKWKAERARLSFSSSFSFRKEKELVEAQSEPYTVLHIDNGEIEHTLHVFNVGTLDAIRMLAPFLRFETQEYLSATVKSNDILLFLRLLGVVDF